MTDLEALNSAAAPLHRHFSDVALVSWSKRKRSKREFDDDYFASCLIALARSGGAASSSAAAVDALKQTKLSSSTATIISYNCTLCGRDFSSRRALSRHKVSHRSKPPAAAGDTTPSNSTSTAETAASDFKSGSHRLHKCLICGSIFPTGQALGGHKRKHYGGVIGRDGGRKSRVSSSEGGSDSSDVTSFSDGNGVVEMAPIARNLELKLPLPFPMSLPSSPYLDLTIKL